jgi:hypothetical protein
MFSLGKLLNNDCYQRAFDESNAALTIASLCLNKRDVYIVDVTKFKKACDDFTNVLMSHNKKEKLLDFYFWVRARLTLLFSKKTTRLGVRMNCHATVKKIDPIITNLCRELYGAKISPLLVNFTYDNPEQEPTHQG